MSVFDVAIGFSKREAFALRELGKLMDSLQAAVGNEMDIEECFGHIEDLIKDHHQLCGLTANTILSRIGDRLHSHEQYGAKWLIARLPLPPSDSQMINNYFGLNVTEPDLSNDNPEED